MLALVAKFESDLNRLRGRDGTEVAKGRVRGKQPKLSRRQEAHLVSLLQSGEYATAEVAELLGSAAPRQPRYRAANASLRRPTSRK